MSFRALLDLDARLSDQLRVAEKPGLLRTLAILFAHSGDSWFWGIGLILLWYFGTPNWKQWAVLQFTCILGLIVLVLAVKFIIRRRRPEGDWGSIYRNTDPHSFPSGHAARSFLIAVIAAGLGPPWVAVVLWIWAPLVSLARVAMGVHYLSDVAAGVVFGGLVALIGLQVYQPLMAWISGWLGFPLY